MTRVDFMPDDHVTITQEVDIPPEELAEFVRSGRWRAPAPYTEAAQNAWLQVILQGQRVVVVAVSPLNADAATEPAVTLNPRMLQVLEGMSAGLTHKEIAVKLGLHTRTVSIHIARIKEVLGTATLAQTVARAAALGLCPPPQK